MIHNNSLNQNLNADINSEMNSPKKKVIVVGAGWAGLSAAVTLAQNGVEVTLLEAAPKAGGRARAISFQTMEVDNGQHILIGAYQHTLALLHAIGIAENSVFTRLPLRLWIESSDSGIDLKFNNLLYPLNLMLAFITAKGFSKQERKAALRFYRALSILHFEISHDISVQELLLEYRQPPALIAHLWEPLARAALSTPIAEASAQVFLQVLKNTFAKQNKHSNFLFPKTNLSHVFPKPMLHYLNQQRAHIHYNQRVQSLILNNRSRHSIQTKNQTYKAANVILAIPPDQAAKLLSPHLSSYSELATWQHKLEKFQFQPITTVYLEFDKPIKLPYFLLGLVQQTGHWLFDRITVGEPNILSIVITGKGEHLELSHSSLVTILYQELKQKFRHLGPVKNYKVITEKKAAFSCRVGIETDRPLAKLPIPGIFLAGDYTEVGYPASLEAAVQSGVNAAHLVLSRLSTKVIATLSDSISD